MAGVRPVLGQDANVVMQGPPNLDLLLVAC